MPPRNWTKPQNDAITARGGALLVSAAAGSGKTAVLVERAVSLICDRENPVDADRLLVVTFSNAAAAEMKQRMSLRLSEMIRENPLDLYLQRQQTLLATAQISTVHSFCLDLIRANFQNLDVSPDFSIADENELELLKNDCAAALVERYYQNDQTGVFRELVELLFTGRDDAKLVETVLKIYDFSRSHPFFEDWLDEKLAMYDPEIPVGETVWGKSILRYAKDSLTFCERQQRLALESVQADEKMEKAYGAAFRADLCRLADVLDAVNANDWDGAVAALSAFEFLKLGPLRGDDAGKRRAKDARERTKDTVKALAEKYLNTPANDFRQDIEDLRPKIAVLFSLVKDFSADFSAAKAEKKRLDFSDFEHLALRLLVRKTENGYERTPRALEIAARYDHVLVDEYQDTNEAQDLIFTSVSREQKNLFMVGDVKQSIYGFRQAMPEIFMAKKQKFFPFDIGFFPAKINLDTNFRSRREVTGAVNFLFSMLMSNEMGEIDYNDGESLKCGASYPEYTAARPSLLLISTEKYEGDHNQTELEAAEIAKTIAGMLDSGYMVADGENMRPAVPRDFCVLLRSPKNKSDVYVRAFLAAGVPAWSERAGGYLQAREVSAVISMLKAVDNPLLDIDLVAAMLSPFFDFTDDDVAAIRLLRRGAPFYTALNTAARENEKAASFLRVFHELRAASAILPADKLIMRFYDLTDALSVVRAMPMGKSRAANLLLLLEYAAHYHKLGYKQLGGFVGFLSRLAEKGGDLAPANTMGDGADVVRVMSAHRSKGLEFPVVFLADAGKTFNKTDLRQSSLLHSRYGFACLRRDRKRLIQFSTVPMQAIRLESERSVLSEEMRILYVALTRAKEKLVISALVKGDPGKKLSRLSCKAVSGKLPPYVVGEGNSYSDWILSALLHHKSAAVLREAAGIDDNGLIDDGNDWAFMLREPSGEALTGHTEPAAQTISFLPDPALREELARRLAFTYPNTVQTKIPAKLAVSAAAKGGRDLQYRFSARPKFMAEYALTAAEKGNAMHKFMQFCDYSAAKNDLNGEIARMERQAFLSKAETDSLNRSKLRAFFESGLANRMFLSGDVRRELKFMAECGRDILGGIIPGMDGSSKIVLQGVADCVFFEDGKAVIVDYKTDHVTTPGELIERYEAQLILYRVILSKSLGAPVKECLLYSFALQTEIPLL